MERPAWSADGPYATEVQACHLGGDEGGEKGKLRTDTVEKHGADNDKKGMVIMRG